MVKMKGKGDQKIKTYVLLDNKFGTTKKTTKFERNVLFSSQAIYDQSMQGSSPNNEEVKNSENLNFRKRRI